MVGDVAQSSGDLEVGVGILVERPEGFLLSDLARGDGGWERRRDIALILESAGQVRRVVDGDFRVFEQGARVERYVLDWQLGHHDGGGRVAGDERHRRKDNGGYDRIAQQGKRRAAKDEDRTAAQADQNHKY